jgi:hypothetical protein
MAEVPSHRVNPVNRSTNPARDVLLKMAAEERRKPTANHHHLRRFLRYASTAQAVHKTAVIAARLLV